MSLNELIYQFSVAIGVHLRGTGHSGGGIHAWVARMFMVRLRL